MTSSSDVISIFDVGKPAERKFNMTCKITNAIIHLENVNPNSVWSALTLSFNLPFKISSLLKIFFLCTLPPSPFFFFDFFFPFTTGSGYFEGDERQFKRKQSVHSPSSSFFCLKKCWNQWSKNFLRKIISWEILEVKPSGNMCRRKKKKKEKAK